MGKKAEPDFGESGGPAAHSARWRFGEFELDERKRELRRQGELLEIEPKPLNLLMLFLRHPGELITKNDLFEALWPGRIVVDAVISTSVARLRSVLGPETAASIKTMSGFGYRFDIVAELLPDPETTIAAPKLALAADDYLPQRPNWKLIRRLGRSGDSWLAEHVKTRAKRVFKLTDDPRALSALKREVTIFRLMRESLGDKTCYVELLDWNFDAPPWFVESEYCPGGSLEEWFEAQGGVSKVPLESRLDLVAQIAETLADVHIIGVLHKDLKPANIFVVIGDDNRPQIRLADFGSGRVLDAAQLEKLKITRMGFTTHIDPGGDANTGTLLYLAPEVVNGQPATIKADIYALGVVLYQCVIGNLCRPVSPGWEQEVEDELLREDIAAASNGSPERRTADAAELARNLRSLNQRRIDRAAERAAIAKAEAAARAMDRMKARRIGLITAFAALTIGFVVSAFLYLDARKARNVAEAETRRAEKVAAFLGEDMFKAVNTDKHPVKDLTVKELLDSATAAVEARFKGEPDIAAKVYEALGRSFETLEYIEEAGANIERALLIRQRSGVMASDDSIRLTTDLIGLKYPVGQLPSKIGEYQKIYDAAAAELPASDTRLIALRIALARGRVQVGEFQRGADELSDLYQQLVQAGGDDAKALLSGVRNGLCYVLIELGRYPDAERLLNEAIQIATAERGPRAHELSTAKTRLARVNYETGRLVEAEALLNQAEDIAKDWGEDRGTENLNILLYRAWLRIYQGRYQEAIALIKKIQIIVSAEPSQNGFDQTYTEDRPLGLALIKLGRREEGVVVLRRGLASAEKQLGLDHPWAVKLRMDIANLEFSQVVGK